ncbi:hypothetical protein [Caviibacterium pharyngocola]|uniref:6-phosphofructokinase n=1 Tax=Caviibacterium pharyngocola TaxID=28159 RepID=A0A2M8RY77_9PAST|nr:hypothetical protein [Caviibacterium pharyngocola]PJG83843.1 hypothetical protein CVP04_01775 [Caviibacterium pharyngocola]
MKKILILTTALLLTACVSPPQLSAPQTITHNDKTYYQVSQQDLGNIARYVYVNQGESAQEWKSAVELLQDRNWEMRTLDERITLRKRVYQNTGVENFDIYRKDDTLYAFVIYEPTAANKDWQVDVAKGKDILHCGFVQYQYSLKVAKNKKLMNMKKNKVVNYLKKYVVDKEMQQLIQEQWSLGCLK